MDKHSANNTRELLLATGEQLCLYRGFTAMGLSELLKIAGVPKGSFYHHFHSKEAFGVAMLERYNANYYQRLQTHFLQTHSTQRELLIMWYQTLLGWFFQHEKRIDCLTVKLSAEVCDLSEDMRCALDNGATQVISVLAQAVEKGKQENSLQIAFDSLQLAQVIFNLWLGASLQAKISVSAAPLENALTHFNYLLAQPTI